MGLHATQPRHSFPHKVQSHKIREKVGDGVLGLLHAVAPIAKQNAGRFWTSKPWMSERAKHTNGTHLSSQATKRWLRKAQAADLIKTIGWQQRKLDTGTKVWVYVRELNCAMVPRYGTDERIVRIAGSTWRHLNQAPGWGGKRKGAGRPKGAKDGPDVHRPQPWNNPTYQQVASNIQDGPSDNQVDPHIFSSRIEENIFLPSGEKCAPVPARPTRDLFQKPGQLFPRFTGSVQAGPRAARNPGRTSSTPKRSAGPGVPSEGAAPPRAPLGGSGGGGPSSGDSPAETSPARPQEPQGTPSGGQGNPSKPLGGSAPNSILGGAQGPRIWRGIAPPYPGVSNVPSAVVPDPPKLDPELPEHEQVRRVVFAYRGAVESRYGGRCFVFGRRGDASKSKHYSRLLAATKMLVEHEIPPAAWAAFSCAVWSKHNGNKKPPPVTWVFSAPRIEEKRGWFRNEEGAFGGGRVVMSEAHKDLITRYGRMRLALQGARTRSEAEQVVQEYFPGDLYIKLANRARQEAEAMQAKLRQAALRGDWLW